jgi:6-phosphogluconolactonase/glucosamine-6-phosphate isomerase/deaminase
VTMTLPTIQSAGQIVFIVGGADKADAVAAAFEDDPSDKTPASLARLAPVGIKVFLDRPAASKLGSR